MGKSFNGVFEKRMSHPRLTSKPSSFMIKFSSISSGKNMLPKKGDILILVVQIPMYNKIKHRHNYLFKVYSLILWEPMVEGPYTLTLTHHVCVWERENRLTLVATNQCWSLVYRPMRGIDIGSKDLTSLVWFF